MSFLKTIFKSGTDAIIGSVGNVIDNLTGTDEEKSRAKAQLADIVLDRMAEVFQAQAEALQTEMQGNWLQRSWRPIIMLTFAALLVIRWTGIATYQIPLELEIKLMDIIQLGLGGYVIGRSVEKVAGKFSQGVDIPFLKKKDRKPF